MSGVKYLPRGTNGVLPRGRRQRKIRRQDGIAERRFQKNRTRKTKQVSGAKYLPRGTTGSYHKGEDNGRYADDAVSLRKGPRKKEP